MLELDRRLTLEAAVDPPYISDAQCFRAGSFIKVLRLTLWFRAQQDQQCLRQQPTLTLRSLWLTPSRLSSSRLRDSRQDQIPTA